MNNSPTTEDRVWAVISHLSTLAFGMGIALPVVGWSDQRRKSNYASFQSLQALGYQSLGFTIWILSYLVLLILAAIVLLVTSGAESNSSGSPDTVLSPGIIVLLVVMLGFLALYLLLPVIAAVACALGKDFRYPILGDRLARYLGYDLLQKTEEQDWLIEDHEFRWVVAMGHFSILIMLWGMLTPLMAWILYGKRSLFLKFQAIQTLVYQAGVTILYFIGAFLYSVGLLVLIVSMEWLGQPNGSSSLGMFGIVIVGGVLIFSILIILLVPLLHILGQWAGYRVLKGDDYHYPLVGRWVNKWISKKPVIEEEPA
ncbi:MAG: DUF4870 domain-containing protein [Chloroflexi bacterium]|nr:MAG: DUF4870 domain-containing protein [Chloroflexota bacterium]